MQKSREQKQSTTKVIKIQMQHYINYVGLCKMPLIIIPRLKLFYCEIALLMLSTLYHLFT